MDLVRKPCTNVSSLLSTPIAYDMAESTLESVGAVAGSLLVDVPAVALKVNILQGTMAVLAFFISMGHGLA